MTKAQYFDKTFFKDLIKKAIPLILGVVIFNLITLIDNFMIGQFQSKNSHELASASIGLKYTKIGILVTTALLTLFSFIVPQLKGAKKEEDIKDVFKLMVLFVVISSVILIAIAEYQADHILQFFQGHNFNTSSSTKSGTAQSYLRWSAFLILTTGLYQVFFVALTTWGIQKIIIYEVIIVLVTNTIFNYLFYKVAGMGLNGIVLSSLVSEVFTLLIYIWWLFYKGIAKYILFNPFLIFKINIKYLWIGLRRWLLAFQSGLWGMISIGITIIYSRWYGDIANERLAIAMPIVAMFYTALDGIAATKGYFVGIPIGAQDKDLALLNDKRINMYTFITALIEGFLLMALAFVLPKLWSSVGSNAQYDAGLLLLATGATYPLAALTKGLLGSFKVAGMGKEMVLSNGLFALFFEFMIPLILYILFLTTSFNIDFWELFLISRLIKLLKFPPTYYLWKKKKWLYSSINNKAMEVK